MLYFLRNGRGGTMSKRAVGVIRVSEVKGREGDSFRSPENQRERMAKLCESSGWRLGEVYEELDIGGARAIEDRPGLLKAAEAVEAKRAAVVVVGYFDRLVRDPHVRDLFVDRIETAGGEVWTADMGKTSNGTAAERFVGGVLAQAARFVRDSAAEKARAAQIEAVEAGVWMSPGVPPGLVLAADRRLTPDPKLAPVVRRAFELRAGGARIEEVRTYLAGHGVKRTRAGITALLRNRTYLGELHFGELRNLEAHPAIVDAATFERVQRVSVPKGRQAKSDHLLARLGVLRCETCGGRMSVTTSNYRYRAYRCGNDECKRRATVAAPLAEEFVVEHVKRALRGIEETAHADHDVQTAAAEADHAEARYAAAVRVLDPLDPGEVDRLREFKAERDRARDRLEEARAQSNAATLAVSVEDWDDLTRDEQRDLIRAVIERVSVKPGRRPDRLAVEWRARR
jgi:site-specific DNA recombinase